MDTSYRISGPLRLLSEKVHEDLLLKIYSDHAKTLTLASYELSERSVACKSGFGDARERKFSGKP